jgi:DNA-binding response OmpR family regulator
MTCKPRILIVEDQPEALSVMVYLLTRAGCNVTTAQTGNEGWRLAREGPFDVITLDIDLPGISGFEICRRLKRNPRRRRTPVIFVSGRLGEEDQRLGLELGAAGYIGKPFDALTFAQQILSHARATKA